MNDEHVVDLHVVAGFERALVFGDAASLDAVFCFCPAFGKARDFEKLIESQRDLAAGLLV